MKSADVSQIETQVLQSMLGVPGVLAWFEDSSAAEPAELAQLTRYVRQKVVMRTLDQLGHFPAQMLFLASLDQLGQPHASN